MKPSAASVLYSAPIRSFEDAQERVDAVPLLIAERTLSGSETEPRTAVSR